MVGFGPEDEHFVAELTYNYGVGDYQLGNDFLVGESSFWIWVKASNIFVHSGNVSIVNRFWMFCIQGLTLQSSQAVNNAKRLGWPLKELGGDVYVTQAPGGYPFYLVDKEHPSTGELHGYVTCQCYNLLIWCQIFVITAGMQTGPGWFSTDEGASCNLWSFAPRPCAEGVSWSVRPAEIHSLLDGTSGNEGDGKKRGQENCAAGIFRQSGDQNLKFAV